MSGIGRLDENQKEVKMKNENTILVVTSDPDLSISDALNQFKFVDPDAPLDKKYADLEESTETILNELAENFEGFDWVYKLLDGDDLAETDKDSIKAFRETVERDKDAYNVQLVGTGAKGDPYRYILSLPLDKPVRALKLYRWENPEGCFLSADIQESVFSGFEKDEILNPSIFVIAKANGESRLYKKDIESLDDIAWSGFIKNKMKALNSGATRLYHGFVSY